MTVLPRIATEPGGSRMHRWRRPSTLSLRIQASRRSALIWWFFLCLLAGLWWDSKAWTYPGGMSVARRQRRQRRQAHWMTECMLQLGAAFIKLGQLLSARPDVFPAAYVEELARLQDRVPPFAFPLASALLDAELGERRTLLLDLDPVPLASASLAQVHRARLPDGRQVVVKLQRPDLERIFRMDLDVMQQLAAALQRHRLWSRGRDWPGLAWECRRVLLRELDFSLEAEHAARFRQQFSDDPMVRVPDVVWELTTRRVLCLHYLPGMKITDRDSLVQAGIDPSDVASRGLGSYLRQLVIFGFFHADPHPGNLAVADDGALIYYDFGMVGTVSPRLRRRIGRMVRCAAARDAAGLTDELQAAGLLARGIDLGPVRRLVRLMLNEALTPPFSQDVLRRLSGDLYDLVYGQPFRLPPELIFVMRALSTFEGVGRSLDPSFTLVEIAKPYLIPLIGTRQGEASDVLVGFGRQVARWGSRTLALPDKVERTIHSLYEEGHATLLVSNETLAGTLPSLVRIQRGMAEAYLIGIQLIVFSILCSASLLSMPLQLILLVLVIIQIIRYQTYVYKAADMSLKQ